MSEETIGELCDEGKANGPTQRHGYTFTYLGEFDCSGVELDGLYRSPKEPS